MQGPARSGWQTYLLALLVPKQDGVYSFSSVPLSPKVLLNTLEIIEKTITKGLRAEKEEEDGIGTSGLEKQLCGEFLGFSFYLLDWVQERSATWNCQHE